MADAGRDRGAAARDDGIVDERVAREYRKLARERSPAALDDRIRARAHRREPRRQTWQRPLAIAATLALAVTLALQLTAPPDRGEPDPASAPGPATLREMPDSGFSPGRSLQPDSAAAAGEALSGLSRDGRRAADSLAGKKTAAVSEHCADHAADAGAWLTCIEALETAGEDAAAQRERRALVARHGAEAIPGD